MFKRKEEKLAGGSFGLASGGAFPYAPGGFFDRTASSFVPFRAPATKSVAIKKRRRYD